MTRSASARCAFDDVNAVSSSALPCPMWNTKVSLPALPVSTSAPPWPSSVLLPVLPKMLLACALPVPDKLPAPSARSESLARRWRAPQRFRPNCEVLYRHGRSKSTSSLGQLYRLGKGEDHARHFGLEHIRSGQDHKKLWRRRDRCGNARGKRAGGVSYVLHVGFEGTTSVSLGIPNLI